MKLTERRCRPCEGGVPPLTDAELDAGLAELPGWTVGGDGRLLKSVDCKDFADAVARLNRIAEVAEAEDHHPDLTVSDYRRLTVRIWTHAIGGLSENDLILAAKIDGPLRST